MVVAKGLRTVFSGGFNAAVVLAVAHATTLDFDSAVRATESTWSTVHQLGGDDLATTTSPDTAVPSMTRPDAR